MRNKFLALITCSFAVLSASSCVVPDGNLASYSTTSLSVLPTGYRTVHVGGNPYYYARNSWYRRSNGRYISCSRPHGYHGSVGAFYGGYGSGYGLSRLPGGFRTVNYGGQIYYNSGSSWYHRRGGRYHQCSAPRGYSSYHRSSRSHYNPRNYVSRVNYNNRNQYRSSRSGRSSRSIHTNHRSHSNKPVRSSVYRGNLKRAARN